MSLAGKSIAIVGAGVSGLTCASFLANQGAYVHIFDLGRGPGGRMSTRRDTLLGTAVTFDHGAQYFTAKTPLVQSMVDRWTEAGVIAAWTGTFGTWDDLTGVFVKDETGCRYVGVPEMSSICKHLSEHAGIRAQYSVQVSNLDWSETDSNWQVRTADGLTSGPFDGAVLSCAYKTMKVGVNILRTDANSEVVSSVDTSVEEVLSSVKTAPSFALMAVTKRKVEDVGEDVPFDGALVTGSSVLSWVTRNNSKPGRTSPESALSVSSTDCWVLHSTSEYASMAISKLPPGKPTSESLSSVAEEMIAEAKKLVPSFEDILFLKVHRWGGAFPVPQTSFDWVAEAPRAADEFKPDFIRTSKDPATGTLAICGDFNVGPRVEQAILSGVCAANYITRKLSTSKL